MPLGNTRPTHSPLFSVLPPSPTHEYCTPKLIQRRSPWLGHPIPSSSELKALSVLRPPTLCCLYFYLALILFSFHLNLSPAKWTQGKAKLSSLWTPPRPKSSTVPCTQAMFSSLLTANAQCQRNRVCNFLLFLLRHQMYNV